jgi:anti-anti-sigma regulatory factor
MGALDRQFPAPAHSSATLRARQVDRGTGWALELSGEADIATVTMLGQELADAVGMDREDLVVDLTGLRFCDVQSAHLIRTARRPKPVSLTGATGSVKRVFELLDTLHVAPDDPASRGAPHSC